MSVISLAQGSDHTVEISGLGDLTGAVLHLAVRNETGTVIISKATNVNGEGLLVAPTTGGVARFYLVPTDTATLVVGGTYSYDAWKVDSTGKHFQVCKVQGFVVTDRVVVL